MAYGKVYEKIGFANGAPPSLGATNLNKIDFTINEIDNRVVELSKQSDEYAKKEEVAETYATKEEVEGISETVTEIATEVSKGKADVILANVSGESIHLTDSTDSKAVEFALLGKATQKHYSGKSLLPVDLVSGTTLGSIVSTVNDDGSFTLKGTASSSAWFAIYGDGKDIDTLPLPNGTYKLTYNNPYIYASFGKITFTDGSNTTLGLNVENREIEFTVTDDKKAKTIWMTFNSGQAVDSKFYPMVRKADVTDNTWEPYVGGIPSPNPEYKQDIAVSGASGSVEVKSLGKNFIPYPYYEKNHTDNGVEWIDLGDGRLKANGTATANSDYFMVSYNAMRTFKAGTYIVNGCPNGGGESTHSIIVGKKVDGTLTRIALANENGTTLTLTEDTEIYILCRVNAGQTVSNLIFEPMISLEGGKFEPYKESTTTITTEGGLAGINGVCDEIVKYADGSGKHIQKIGKKTITSVSSKVASTKNNMFMVSVSDMKAPATNNDVKPLLCTHFEAKDSYTTLYNKDSVQITTHQNKYIILCFGLDENFDTVAEVNTWLGKNNVTVYYELAEPIITELSAEEITELEVQTFYPTTNILNDSGCGMEVTYKADTKNYIDKIIGERITALETALINNI